MIDLKQNIGDLEIKEVVIKLPNSNERATFRIKEMGGLQRFKFESLWSSYKDSGPDLALRFAALIVFSVINEKDELVYSEDDIEAIAARNPELLMELFQQCSSINKMGQGDVVNLAKK